jgi:hypothetical protein
MASHVDSAGVVLTGADDGTGAAFAVTLTREGAAAEGVPV